jgi:pilus assembly protein Flp/PilA
MKKFVLAFLKDEAGLTMVEYAVAGALVVAVGAAAFTPLGQAILARIQAITALI